MGRDGGVARFIARMDPGAARRSSPARARRREGRGGDDASPPPDEQEEVQGHGHEERRAPDLPLPAPALLRLQMMDGFRHRTPGTLAGHRGTASVPLCTTGGRGSGFPGPRGTRSSRRRRVDPGRRQGPWLLFAGDTLFRLPNPAQALLRSRPLGVWLLAARPGLAPASATAQAPAPRPTLRAGAIPEACTWTAGLDEPGWRQADSIPVLTMTEPVEGGRPVGRTVVRVLADADALVIGVVAYDPEPESDRVLLEAARSEPERGGPRHPGAGHLPRRPVGIRLRREPYRRPLRRADLGHGRASERGLGRDLGGAYGARARGGGPRRSASRCARCRSAPASRRGDSTSSGRCSGSRRRAAGRAPAGTTRSPRSPGRAGWRASRTSSWASA